MTELMARRDPAAGVRLLTCNGYDWTARYPLIRQAVDRLRVRSCDWAIGRIYEGRGGPDNMRWFWSLYGMVGKAL